MKLSLICVALAVALSAAACGPRQPAYRDINTNQPAPSVNQTPDGTMATPPSGNNNAPPAPTGQAAPMGAAQLPAFRMPAFMDAAKGSPKDLPNYPGAAIVSIQYGPREDTDTFSVAMQTGDSMDKIAAFYDKVVKSNGWDVTQRQIDPEYSEWRMKKGVNDEAQVTVRKPPQGKTLVIAAARTAKPAPPQTPKP
ncbi:MAG: hypothetical protein ACJ74J_14440 [Blastocatellia bacterium]